MTISINGTYNRHQNRYIIHTSDDSISASFDFPPTDTSVTYRRGFEKVGDAWLTHNPVTSVEEFFTHAAQKLYETLVDHNIYQHVVIGELVVKEPEYQVLTAAHGVRVINKHDGSEQLIENPDHDASWDAVRDVARAFLTTLPPDTLIELDGTLINDASRYMWQEIPQEVQLATVAAAIDGLDYYVAYPEHQRETYSTNPVVMENTHVNQIRWIAGQEACGENPLAIVLGLCPILAWGFTYTRDKEDWGEFALSVLEPIPKEHLNSGRAEDVFVFPYHVEPRGVVPLGMMDDGPVSDMVNLTEDYEITPKGLSTMFSVLGRVMGTGVFDRAVYDTLTNREKEQARAECLLWHDFNRRLFQSQVDEHMLVVKRFE
jgi:hypothetical protein